MSKVQVAKLKYPVLKESPSEQPVTIHKETNIQSFTPEEELKYLIQQGDWEIISTLAVFQARSLEAQAQILCQAIDNRIEQLDKSLNYLAKRGAEHHAAAMGVLGRSKQLQRIRDDILKGVYEQFTRSIASDTRGKIDFY